MLQVSGAYLSVQGFSEVEDYSLVFTIPPSRQLFSLKELLGGGGGQKVKVTCLKSLFQFYDHESRVLMKALEVTVPRCDLKGAVLLLEHAQFGQEKQVLQGEGKFGWKNVQFASFKSFYAVVFRIDTFIAVNLEVLLVCNIFLKKISDVPLPWQETFGLSSACAAGQRASLGIQTYRNYLKYLFKFSTLSIHIHRNSVVRVHQRVR